MTRAPDGFVDRGAFGDASDLGDDRQNFCWQSIAALRVIRGRWDGKELTTAIAVYCAFTEVANEQHANGGREGFQAPRRRIAEKAGVTLPTVDKYAREFEKLKLLGSRSHRIGGVNQPNIWRLREPAAAGRVAGLGVVAGSVAGAAVGSQTNRTTPLEAAAAGSQANRPTPLPLPTEGGQTSLPTGDQANVPGSQANNTTSRARDDLGLKKGVGERADAPAIDVVAAVITQEQVDEVAGVLRVAGLHLDPMCAGVANIMSAFGTLGHDEHMRAARIAAANAADPTWVTRDGAKALKFALFELQREAAKATPRRRKGVTKPVAPKAPWSGAVAAEQERRAREGS